MKCRTNNAGTRMPGISPASENSSGSSVIADITQSLRNPAPRVPPNPRIAPDNTNQLSKLAAPARSTAPMEIITSAESIAAPGKPEPDRLRGEADNAPPPEVAHVPDDGGYNPEQRAAAEPSAAQSAPLLLQLERFQEHLANWISDNRSPTELLQILSEIDRLIKQSANGRNQKVLERIADNLNVLPGIESLGLEVLGKAAEILTNLGKRQMALDMLTQAIMNTWPVLEYPEGFRFSDPDYKPAEHELMVKKAARLISDCFISKSSHIDLSSSALGVAIRGEFPPAILELCGHVTHLDFSGHNIDRWPETIAIKFSNLELLSLARSQARISPEFLEALVNSMPPDAVLDLDESLKAVVPRDFEIAGPQQNNVTVVLDPRVGLLGLSGMRIATADVSTHRGKLIPIRGDGNCFINCFAKYIEKSGRLKAGETTEGVIAEVVHLLQNSELRSNAEWIEGLLPSPGIEIKEQGHLKDPIAMAVKRYFDKKYGLDLAANMVNTAEESGHFVVGEQCSNRNAKDVVFIQCHADGTKGYHYDLIDPHHCVFEDFKSRPLKPGEPGDQDCGNANDKLWNDYKQSKPEWTTRMDRFDGLLAELLSPEKQKDIQAQALTASDISKEHSGPQGPDRAESSTASSAQSRPTRAYPKMEIPKGLDERELELFAKIEKLKIEDIGAISSFFTAGQKASSIALRSKGDINVALLEEKCPNAVQFFRDPENYIETKKNKNESWSPPILNELRENIKGMVPEGEWEELEKRIESFHKFITSRYEDPTRNYPEDVVTLCHSWIGFVAQLKGLTQSECLDGLRSFPPAQDSGADDLYSKCTAGMSGRLSDAIDSLDILGKFQSEYLKNIIVKYFSDINSANQVHIQTYLKYLMGLPEDIAKKADSYLHTVRAYIPGEKAFSLVEPSCFCSEILKDILDRAAEHEKTIQKAADAVDGRDNEDILKQRNEELNQALKTMEDDLFLKHIGFPPEKNISRYIEYDFSDEGGTLLPIKATFNKEHFASDLAFALSVSNFLQLGTEPAEQGKPGDALRLNDDTRSVRDAAKTYWDERVEDTDLIIQDIRGDNINLKTKALYMLVCMANQKRQKIPVFSLVLVFDELKDQELAEAVEQCQNKGLGKLSMEHISIARKVTEARMEQIRAPFDHLDSKQIMDFFGGKASAALIKENKGVLERLISVLRMHDFSTAHMVQLIKYLDEANSALDDGEQNELLHSAVLNGEIKFVSSLLRAAKNIDVNRKNDRGNTAISEAIEQDHADVLKLLLGHKGIIVDEIISKNGITPICNAFIKGRLEIIKVFLAARGVDEKILGKDATIDSLLAHLKKNQQLLSDNERHNMKTYFLLKAVKGGQVEEVHRLLDDYLATCGTKDLYHLVKSDEILKLTIDAATNSGHIEILKAFLNAGFQIKFKLHHLQTAINKRSSEIVELMLPFFPVLRTGETLGLIPYVIKRGNEAILEIFLRAGISFKNTNALNCAITHKKPEMIELLIEHGVEVNTPNDRGHTPIYSIALSGNTQLLKELLSVEAIDVRQVFNNFATTDRRITINHNSAYSEAVRKGDTDTANLLIEYALKYNAGSNVRAEAHGLPRIPFGLSKEQYWFAPERAGEARQLHKNLCAIRVNLEKLIAVFNDSKNQNSKNFLLELLKNEDKWLAIAILEGMSQEDSKENRKVFNPITLRVIQDALQDKTPKTIKDKFRSFIRW